MPEVTEYRFVTRWRFNASAEEVFAILSKPEKFPKWWSEVYKSAELVEAGSADGIGRMIRFRTKGFLPYQLRWESHTTDVIVPKRVAVRAAGDLVGQGLWLLDDDAHGATDVMFQWHVKAEKPLLRYFSALFKPLFRANHRWAMEQGRIAIERELVLRRAAQEQEKVLS